MFTLEVLDKWFDRLNKIIFDIKASIDNIKKLANSADDFEKQVVTNGFFYHFYRQSRFVIIIQLCKIFDSRENQKINIFKLFNKLTSDKYDSTLQDLLNKNSVDSRLFKDRASIIKDIEILKTEITINSDIIKRVIDLRDKFYAHSDPESTLPNVSNAELDILVSLAIKIYNSIRSKFLDSTFLFEHNQDWRVDYPVKILAANRKEQREKLNQKIEKKASA